MATSFESVGDEVRLLRPWSSEMVTDLLPESVRRLSLNARHGWKPDGGLDFLKDFRNLSALRVVCLQKVQLDPILHLKSLRALDLQLNPKVLYSLDFQRLPNLESLTLCWNYGFEGIRGVRNLQRLIIKEIYQVNNLDLSGLENLKTLHIVDGRGVNTLTLAGVCCLESLMFQGLPKLEAISGFCAGKAVRVLRLSGVGRIPQTFWKQFSNLERVECGPKESISEESFASPPKSFLRWPK